MTCQLVGVGYRVEERLSICRVLDQRAKDSTVKLNQGKWQQDVGKLSLALRRVQL